MMRTVFGDSVYWIALANPRDQWHDVARQVSRDLGPCCVTTTEEVLIEFLNHFGEHGTDARNVVTRMVRKLLANPNVTVLPQTRNSFLAGLDLYERRSDKGYSLTDCVSIVQMWEHRLAEILTSDHHFRQEGFSLLLAGLAPDK
jgi:uncharacterized protein